MIPDDLQQILSQRCVQHSDSPARPNCIQTINLEAPIHHAGLIQWGRFAELRIQSHLKQQFQEEIDEQESSTRQNSQLSSHMHQD